MPSLVFSIFWAATLPINIINFGIIADIDIMNISDTVLVTTVPEAGDEIQMLKRGLIEIADIFIVNKTF